MIRQKECRVTLGTLAAAFTLAMLRIADGWAATETPASSAPASPVSRLPEVTVTAQRLKLEQRVSKFVDQIAATENGAEGLARWHVPSACPLVSGLPRKDAEFILERLSEIARTAGVPLADKENCRPNLYVLVTDQPEELLRGMEQRNRGFTFGYDASTLPPTQTSATVVDEFIKTARPVRVWYNTNEKDAWGQALAYCPAWDIQEITCIPNYLLNDCNHPPPRDPTQALQCGRAAAGGTHLTFNNMWWLSRVFIIVDQRQLKGVKVGQLADYVAMSGFAKLKPGARLGDTPTILTLFNAAPEGAPTGMTDWDQTFLKSLYATDQISKQQRSQIARAMVHTLAP